MKKFEINADSIKIQKKAGSEESVSHTIEELISLNDLISNRWEEGRRDDADRGITQKQLENNDYTTFNEEPNAYTGEIEEITEGQFGDREEPEKELVQTRFKNEGNKEPGSGVGNREDWDKDESEHRGHQDVPPIWQEVYRKEDKREKLDKGQLDKKK